MSWIFEFKINNSKKSVSIDTQIVNTLKLNLEYYELLIIKLNCAHLVPLYLVPLWGKGINSYTKLKNIGSFYKETFQFDFWMFNFQQAYFNVQHTTLFTKQLKATHT